MIKKLLLTLINTHLILAGQSVLAQTGFNGTDITPVAGLKTFRADCVLRGDKWPLEGKRHISMANNQANWVQILNVRSMDIDFCTTYQASVSSDDRFNVRANLGNRLKSHFVIIKYGLQLASSLVCATLPPYLSTSQFLLHI